MAYQRVTLAELRLSLQDMWENVPFWTQEDADAALNETLRWWNLFTGMWKRTELLQLFQGEHFYDLSSTLIMPANVRFQGYPLALTSVPDLDTGRPNWQAEDTAEPGCPPRPASWAPHGMQTIVVWPALGPLEVGSLEIDGVRNTPVLVNDADFVDLGQDELSPLLGEALFLAAFKEGGPRWQQTMAYHKGFIKAALDKNSRLKASAQFRKWAGLDVQRGQRPFRVPVQDPTQGSQGEQQ
jgi:hypothetical protein